MLEFIIGRAGSGKTTACLNTIKEKLIHSPTGKPLVILLPDHMTFAIERQLALELKDYGGFTRAYVLGMSRLAYQVLMRCGGILHPHLNEIGKELLLSRVLSSTKLSILAKAARQHHFTASVSQIIEEFKTSGISVTTLQDILTLIDNDSLKQKLSDLTSIYAGLDEQMAGRYHDSEDMMELAIKKLPECTWLQDAEIWIDGFDAFNPQHFRVVEQLLALASDIHLTLCINNLNDIEHEAPTALFHRQFNVFQQINNMAKKLAIPTKITTLTANHRHKQQDLAFIEEQLFKFPLTKKNYTGGLQIVEAPNRRLECEAVACDILRLCREENYRHYDIGILIRSSEDYSELLQAVLNDFNIPYFSDSKRQTAHHPLAELIRSSLEAISTWQYEPLFRAFKTDFFNDKYLQSLKNLEENTDKIELNLTEQKAIARKAIDKLENYVLAFGIRGRNRWCEESDWRFSHHKQIDSMGTNLEEEANFTAINLTRRSLVAPLEKFYTACQNSQTIEEYTLALYDFLLDLQIPTQLQLWEKIAQEQNDIALAKEHHQIWDNIIELMDQLVQICGKDYINLENYLKLINDGLDSIQIALIPPGYDYVTLAPFEHNTLNNKKAIYILGANEKIMPRHSKTEGILSDAERLLMASLGLNISSGTMEDNFAERYLLYKGFSLATDYLWVSYALADGEGAGLNKSILITRLQKILPKAKFTAIPLDKIISYPSDFTLEENPLDSSFAIKTMQVSSTRKTLSHLTSALRQARDGEDLASFWQDVYNYLLTADVPLSTALQSIFAQAPKPVLPADLASKLYTKRKTLRGSVTRFEQFFNCPFKHFAHYALNLQERKEFKFAAPDLGILLHAIMHQFGEILVKRQISWQDVTHEQCQQICKQIIKTIAPKLQNEILLSSNRYRHLLQRIEQLSIDSLMRLVEFAKHSEFSPKALEQDFGANSSMPPLLFTDEDNHKIEIIGQIDRIDFNDNYYLVIDYKSGNAFINLLQVYYGLKLQLLTYLLVAQNTTLQLYNMENAIPAGILYCFLKTPIITGTNKLSVQQIKTEIEKKMRMPGWVLADPEIIKKIDDSSNFIKVRLNKNQDDISAQSRSYVKTAEEFDLLMKHIENTLKEAGSEILKGNADIAPYKLKDETACKYCPYIAICRFDKYISGYNYREINQLNDEEIIEKLKQKEGIPCLGQHSNNKL